MEFQFNVNEYFKRPIVEIGNTLLPPDFAGDRRALWNTVNKVAEVVNEMGEASANAQGLNKPITTAERLRQSDQNLYLLVDHGANNGNGSVTGMLKIGRKGLYVFDREGLHYQVTPPCVLDFYIHEKRQRSGLGKKLFEYMLEKENVKPHNLAIDRPSEKFLNFLNKHYYLQNPIKQMNNYVVFDGFFPESQKKQTQQSSPMNRTNGLQSTQSPNSQPLYGRYGAPRPPCSMGQIIHNTTAQKNSEPTSQNNFESPHDVSPSQEKKLDQYDARCDQAQYGQQQKITPQNEMFAPQQAHDVRPNPISSQQYNRYDQYDARCEQAHYGQQQKITGQNERLASQFGNNVRSNQIPAQPVTAPEQYDARYYQTHYGHQQKITGQNERLAPQYGNNVAPNQIPAQPMKAHEQYDARYYQTHYGNQQKITDQNERFAPQHGNAVAPNQIPAQPVKSPEQYDARYYQTHYGHQQKITDQNERFAPQYAHDVTPNQIPSQQVQRPNQNDARSDRTHSGQQQTFPNQNEGFAPQYTQTTSQEVKNNMNTIQQRDFQNAQQANQSYSHPGPQNQQFDNQQPYLRDQMRMFPERETQSGKATYVGNAELQTAERVGNVWPQQAQPQKVYRMTQIVPNMPQVQQDQQRYETTSSDQQYEQTRRQQAPTYRDTPQYPMPVPYQLMNDGSQRPVSAPSSPFVDHVPQQQSQPVQPREASYYPQGETSRSHPTFAPPNQEYQQPPNQRTQYDQQDRIDPNVSQPSSMHQQGFQQNIQAIPYDPTTNRNSPQQYQQTAMARNQFTVQSPHYPQHPTTQEQHARYINEQVYAPPQPTPNFTQHVDQQLLSQSTYSPQRLTPHQEPVRKEKQEYQNVQPSPPKQPNLPYQQRQEQKTDNLHSETVHSLLHVDPKYFKPDPIQLKQPSYMMSKCPPTPRVRKEETVASLLNAEQEFFENGLLRDKYRISSRPAPHNQPSQQTPEGYPKQLQDTERDTRQHIPRSQVPPHRTNNDLPQTAQHQRAQQEGDQTEKPTVQPEHRRNQQQHHLQDQPRAQQQFVPEERNAVDHQLTPQNPQFQQPQQYNVDVRNPYREQQQLNPTHRYESQPQEVYQQQYANTREFTPPQVPSGGRRTERQTYETEARYINGNESAQRNETKSQDSSPQHLADTSKNPPPVEAERAYSKECKLRETVGNRPAEVTEYKPEPNHPPARIRQSSYIANDFSSHPEEPKKISTNTKIKPSAEETGSRKDISRQYGLNEVDMKRKGYKSAIIKKSTDIPEVDNLEYGYPPQISKNVTMPAAVADSVRSSPKLERPKSLEIQTEISVHEPLVQPAVPTVDEDDGPQDDIEPELEKLRINEELAAPSDSSDKDSGKKTPRHLTEQGYFDLKFYHNKLW